MTRHEFVEAWRHEFGGMVLDAATLQAKGADLSIFMRILLRKIDAVLGKQYDAMQEPAKPTTNGHANGVATPKRN